MSQSQFNAIIQRAAQDQAFRTLLLNDLDAALVDYQLTTNEKELLLNLDEAALNNLSMSAEEEIEDIVDINEELAALPGNEGEGDGPIDEEAEEEEVAEENGLAGDEGIGDGPI